MAFFGVLIGISPNYYFLTGFLILMGIMGGGYHPAAAPLVSATVDSTQRGRVLGIHQLGGTASQLVSPLFVAGVITLLGWRGSYISVGVGTFLLGVLLFILLKRNKQGGKATTKMMEKPKPKEKFSANFLVGIIAFLIFSTFIQGLISTTISFSTLFLVDHFVVSSRLAATMYILITIGGLLGGPISGYLSDRLGSLKIVIFLSLLAVPVIYLLTLVPFSFLTVGFLLALIGMCQWGRMPVSESYVINETSERGRSTILGFYYAGGRAFPGLIGPIIGIVTDHWGISVSYTVIAITIAATTVFYLPFILRKRRKNFGIKNDSVL
jgi:MFS family permease